MKTLDAVVELARIGAGQTAARTLSLAAPIDWDAVVELAVQHRVLALVGEGLALSKSNAPEPTLTRIRQRSREYGVAGLVAEQALGALLGLADRAAASVIVLKGASLAHELYPSPALRPYGDLDVLCRREDYPRLYRALTAAHYQTGDDGRLPERLSAWESDFPRGYTSPVGDIWIEFHFDVLQFGVHEKARESLWRDARTIEADGRSLPVLSPVHQLLQLAAHVHRHEYSRLIWMLDLDLHVRRWIHDLDWHGAMQLARLEGMGALLRHAMQVVHAVLETPVPDLGRMTVEERLLLPLYRQLWPASRALQPGHEERHRLVRFYPSTGSPLDVVPAMLLLGRRRDKARVLAAHARKWPHAPRAALAARRGA